MLKIALTYERAVLHTLLVYDVATQGELPDDIGAPLAELSGTDGVDTIAHGNDGIEVIELLSRTSLTFLWSCRVFLGNCIFNKFIHSSYMFFRCKPMLSAEQSKSTAIAFW